MSRRRSSDISGEFGRRNLSKIAITRNIEMRIAVATNPKETAFTELSNWLQLSSDLSTFRGGDPLGCHPQLSFSAI